jgi:hypothetical protein
MASEPHPGSWSKAPLGEIQYERCGNAKVGRAHHGTYPRKVCVFVYSEQMGQPGVGQPGHREEPLFSIRVTWFV